MSRRANISRDGKLILGGDTQGLEEVEILRGGISTGGCLGYSGGSVIKDF